MNTHNPLPGAVPSLHQLIEHQVARTPELEALRFKGQSLSYAELDRRAACGQPAVPVLLHSFTPVMNGIARPWHCGVLYNRDTARYSATLLTADSQPALKVEAHEDYLKVEPLTLAAIEPGQSLELWAIPPDGKPISLGVIPAGGKGKVELSETQKALIGKPIALAVSLEPKGGSPTGQPTGPVLYQGSLAVL